MKTQCHKKINKWFISHVKTKFLFFKEIFYLCVGGYSDVQSPEEALDALELQGCEPCNKNTKYRC